MDRRPTLATTNGSDGHAALLMSTLCSDGRQVESKIAPPLGEKTNNISSSSSSNNNNINQNRNNDDDLSGRSGGPGEENAFYVYQILLRLGPFKRAICLLGLIALGLLLTQVCFAGARYQQGLLLAHQHGLWWLPALVCLAELLAVGLVAQQTLFRFQLERATPQRDHFGRLQLALLLSSALFACLLASQRAQLIAFQPIIMFILYTLLSVNNRRAFFVTLPANLIHLASVPFFLSSPSPVALLDDPDTVKSFVRQERLVPILVMTYVLFHAIGLYLNKQTLRDRQCQESYNDIKSFLWARKNMDFEDKRLNRMLDSAIPEHLAREMRADIEQPNSNGRFNKIYLARYENVSILFADIVNFTKISSAMEAPALVITLNELFGRFDRAAQINKCLRIKILGDCYYCVCGIPDKTEDHAAHAVEMGLDMIEILGCLANPQGSNKSGGPSDVDLNMRVGIHSGQVFCGVLGKKRWQFDVHSNDVKKANEAEQSGQPGRVHITQSTRRALAGRYELEPKGDKQPDHPGATFFVKPPESRRQRSLEASKFSCDSSAALSPASGPSASGGLNLGQPLVATPRPSVAASDAYSTSAPAAAGESSTGTLSRPLIEGCRALAAVASPTTTLAPTRPDQAVGGAAGALGGSNPAEQQQQQLQTARVRFRSAGKRLITMLYLIDPPFSNLAPPTQVKTSRLLLQTIQKQQSQRRSEADVHPIWLTFADKHIGQLYERERVSSRELAQRLAIFFLGAISLLALVYVSQPTSVSRQEIASAFGPTEKIAPLTDASNTTTATTTTTTTTTSAEQNTTTTRRQRVMDLLDTLESFTLIGEIMFAFVLSVLVYVHQTEYSKRRDFFWRQKAKRDKERVSLMRSCNRYIFFNLLPPHVANYFLDHRPQLSRRPSSSSGAGGKQATNNHMSSSSHAPQQQQQQQQQPASLQPETRLYSQSYRRIGVVFATISNFVDFYSEERQQGLECLRLLNEIICDFDSIMEDSRFQSVEKIKTIGATYMAAIGLLPDSELPSGCELAPTGSTEDDDDHEKEREEAAADWNRHDPHRAQIAKCLQILVEFVFEMKSRLHEISEHSFNVFKLRAGINLGPVTAGVIGASKPQYDIWGNTVNVASRMESTAESDRIQITEEVFDILKDFNQETQFRFTCRKNINVKGKGMMTTYYLDKSVA